jgi:hypothetical protein
VIELLLRGLKDANSWGSRDPIVIALQALGKAVGTEVVYMFGNPFEEPTFGEPMVWTAALAAERT